MKRGVMSGADKEKMIKLFAEGKTAAQIARKLDRSEAFITKSLPKPEVAPAPETPQAPKLPTVGEVMLQPGRKKGVVVMTEVASQLADEVPKGGANTRFSNCITKAQQ